MIQRAPALSLLLAFLSTPAWGQDPFAEGERWHHDATTQAPWVPSGVAFSGREDLVWAGSKGSTGGMMLFHTAASGSQVPRATDPTTHVGATYLESAAGRRAEALFSLTQSPNPGPYQRRTRVFGYDGASAPVGGLLSPGWTHDVGFDTNGPARLAVDREGTVVLVAVWNNLTSRVQLDWLDGTRGTLLMRRTVSALALDALALSADGKRTAVSTGTNLVLFDETGTILHVEPLNNAVHCLTWDANGTTVAVGGAGQVALLEEQARNWVNRLNVTRGPQQIATAVDLDQAGDVLGIGWWEASAGVDVELEVWDTRKGLVLNSKVLPGVSGGAQNRVEVVDVSSDGKRVAFGTWGNGIHAEMFLLDVGVSQSVLESSLPGSVRDLEIDESGSQLAVAYQDAHRSQFTNTGGVALFQSGDRELVQLDPAELGAGLRLATRKSSATLAFLLYGQRANPIQFPGVQGLLHIDRKTLAYQWQVPQAGRAQFLLSIPTDASLIGTHFAVQAAFRTPTGTILSPHVVDPLILP